MQNAIYFRKIVEKPTLLEVFSYVFFYPACIVGPTFEFADFRKFINLEAEYNQIRKELAIHSAMKELGKSVICVFIFQIAKTFYDINYLISEDFYNHNFFVKVKF